MRKICKYCKSRMLTSRSSPNLLECEVCGWQYPKQSKTDSHYPVICNHDRFGYNTLSDWISDGVYRWRKCIVCGKIIIKEKISENQKI